MDANDDEQRDEYDRNFKKIDSKLTNMRNHMNEFMDTFQKD